MGELIAIGFLLFIFSFIGLLYFLCRYLGGESKNSRSPYTKKPLRRADSLPFPTMYLVQKYMEDNIDYVNRPFSFRKAAFCRDTGRIFTNAIKWNGKISVSWNFLQKVLPGHYVSWGSLSEDKKRKLLEKYGSLSGFQTDRSSTKNRIEDVEPEFIYLKPGPLYVNIDQEAVVGWKMVPDTDIEVLIVQRPKVLI